MTNEFAQAVSRYKEEVIDQKGRTELLKKFREHFGFKSDDTFHRIVTRGEGIPTPDQNKWIVENINYYWEYYASIDKETV